MGLPGSGGGRVAPGRKALNRLFAGCRWSRLARVFPAAIKGVRTLVDTYLAMGNAGAALATVRAGYQRVYRRLSQLRRVAGLTDSERRAWEELGTYRKR